ncbi:unnamed protein product [Nezara viridula]|uniref:Odorant receptor n=1 Tax=Nezara viridula TaxID=85310 RepID=A0A9P0MVQ8_NEZVI|nr:unnamed protein product [Nezara viridula]
MNRNALVRFHRTMAKNFYDYKEKNTDFIDRLRKETEKEVKLFSMVPISTVVGAVTGFVLSPILDKYGTYIVEDVSHHLNINLPAPFIAYQFSTHTHAGFFFAYILQIWELPGTSLTSSVLGCIEVGYMAFISFLGQQIIDLNDELRVKMYESKWYYGSKRTKNSIQIFQQMTLKPLVIMSASIIPINLDTFAMVMNSAYSYYNLINAFS